MYAIASLLSIYFMAGKKVKLPQVEPDGFSCMGNPKIASVFAQSAISGGGMGEGFCLHAIASRFACGRVTVCAFDRAMHT